MLKGQQKEFCDYLLQDPEQNAGAAYRKAYPKCESDKAARANASKLLTNHNIQEYLTNAKAQRSERTRIDADWLLTRLADEADADVADIFDEAGNLLPVRSWPKIFRQGLVAGIDVSNVKAEGGNVSEVVKIKLADRNAKLKMIGEHIGVQAFRQQSVMLEVKQSSTPLDKACTVLSAMADGKITLQAGQALIDSISKMIAIEEQTELAKRIEQLEAALNNKTT